MGRLTGRSRTVSRITGSAAVTALLTACMVSDGEAGVRTPSRAGEAIARRDACTPQVLLLPARTPTEVSTATAINDDGWVAGWVAVAGRKGRAMLWRDNAPPLDLGLNGIPVDINEDGNMAIQRGSTAFLWSDGTLRRLRGTRWRPHVYVNALNDHHVVVGDVSRIDAGNDRAAVWRNERLRMQRHPPGCRPDRYSGWYRGVNINNSGLVIG